MKKLISTILISKLLIMSLFGSSSKETKSDQKESEMILLGMVLLEESNSLNINDVVNELREKWKLIVDDKETSNEASILFIEDYRIAIVNMDIPIPGNEIKSTAEYNYLWPNGTDEATKHKGHVILSLLNAGKDPIKENTLFSKVASSILNNSKSLGIYIGSRSLLIKKEMYLSSAKTMTSENLPLLVWIYFGMREENGKRSIYTYGLTDFQKMEMEIINSTHSFEDLLEMMLSMAHYVILSNVTLRDGETMGISETQRLRISISKGKYLPDKSIKIEY